MYSTTLLTLLTLLSTSLSAPLQTIEERHILTETHQYLPRQQQQNIPQLLSIASLAGITLPTDPAALLSLGPVAASLQSYLPTPSVLSVLQTAAPPDFISKVVHDPSYAMSFEEAFAAGSSPSWFLALPTDVKNYLHTYSGFGGVATAVGNFESVNSGASTGSRSGAATMTGSKATSTTSASGTMESAGAQSTMPAQSPSSGGMRSTGSLVLALAGAVGVLGVAIAL
ncbi:MAG: hypothetical protein L6R40_001117 [Gallowayella cf. fulva]|nr:MAG: hypothetical protein L6R40_001117 [Xanthomendoza cf. fulva]